MITLENILLSLKMEVYEEENNFTSEQRKQLSELLNSIDTSGFPDEREMLTIHPFKLAKAVKKYNKANKEFKDKSNQFEEMFFSFGGRKDRMDALKDKLIKQSVPFIGGAAKAARKAGFRI